MNFSIHIDDSMARKLESLAKKSRKTRNALINEALRHFLEHNRRSKWPQAVIELAGSAKDLEPFEKFRSDLTQVPEDPLA